MDPISATLLAALMTAIEKKVGGAATDYLMTAARRQAQRLAGLLDGSDAKQAEAILTHVLAESATFPPERAIRVEPLSTVSIVGIWPPRGRLALDLLWINRADFPILIRNLRVAARVGGPQDQWVVEKGDEFTLPPRGDTERRIEGEPSMELPPLERGCVNCDITVSALVCGPWEHGLAQRTHELYRGGVVLPSWMEQDGLLSAHADVDIVLEAFLQTLVDKGVQQQEIRYAALDRQLDLRPGSSKERLPTVAAARSHKLNAGPSVALLSVHYPAEPHFDHPGAYGVSGSSRNPFGDSY